MTAPGRHREWAQVESHNASGTMNLSAIICDGMMVVREAGVPGLEIGVPSSASRSLDP